MKQYEQHIRQLIDEKNKVEDFKYNAISEFDDGNFNVTTRGTRTIDIASKTREMEKRSYYGQETTTVPLPLLTLSAQPDGQYSIDSGSGMIREWDKFEFKAHHIKELAEFLEKVMFENEHMTDYLEEDDD
jgi:beta-glucanase (GH16 family)